MKINHIEINGYKQFTKFKGEFLNNDYSEEVSHLNLLFLIGQNGTGKTSLLEAIALIFAKTTLNQSPGFEFFIEYSLSTKYSINTIVRIRSKELKIKENRMADNALDFDSNSKFSVEVSTNNETFERIYTNFSEHPELHPQKFFSIASGPHNIFEDIIINSPKQELLDEIVNSSLNDGSDVNLHNHMKNIYDSSLFNPKFLNFDSSSYIYIFISLLFFQPSKYIHSNKNIREVNNNYFEKIDSLMKNVKKIKPISFSIKISHDHYNVISKSVDSNYERTIQEEFYNTLRYLINDLSTYSIESIDERTDEKVIVFTFEKKNFHEKINNSDEFENIIPLEALTLFTIAHRIGFIKESSVQLLDTETQTLVTHKILSDGEWMWLCKMGLIIISQIEEENNYIYLFDEPDTFLNENWVEDYIYNLNKYSEIKYESLEGELKIKSLNHQYLITTHSTLLLTDALQGQVYILDKSNGEITIKNMSISTFGADRSYISSKLFLNEKRIGRFSDNQVTNTIREKNEEKVDFLLEELGPGYERFKIEELKINLENEKNNPPSQE